MTLSPWYVGQTQPPLRVTFTDDTGAAVDLTGATLTVEFNNNQGTRFAGGGNFNIVTPTAGVFTYAVAASDVATAGWWSLQFKVTLPAGGVRYADPIVMNILAPE